MKFYIKAKAEEIGKRINSESKKLIEIPTKLKSTNQQTNSRPIADGFYIQLNSPSLLRKTSILN